MSTRTERKGKKARALKQTQVRVLPPTPIPPIKMATVVSNDGDIAIWDSGVVSHRNDFGFSTEKFQERFGVGLSFASNGIEPRSHSTVLNGTLGV
jgi:hypothetical protein